MDAIIRAEKLCKSYSLGKNEIPVLKDVSIEIGKGEFVSVMGPSGSGKSTLLYLLGCLDAPSAGRVFVGDVELSQMTDAEASAYRRRRLGFVFQFYNLVPNLTVEENTLLPVLLDGQKARKYKQRLDEVIEIVGLGDRRRHRPAELSGGQQQRVAIARALIHDPEIILADEPTGNLDSKTGTGIMELLRDINLERGKTIVQVTHSPEAARYGNRIITLRDGETV
jgi:putative ABC transport system ATP-binding protein